MDQIFREAWSGNSNDPYREFPYHEVGFDLYTKGRYERFCVHAIVEETTFRSINKFTDLPGSLEGYKWAHKVSVKKLDGSILVLKESPRTTYLTSKAT